jgi:hypothetical protein
MGQQPGQDQVLEAVGVVPGVEGVTVAQHGVI